MNRARHAGTLDCEEMKENIARQSEAANVHGDVHSLPRSLLFGLDLLDFHSKLHAKRPLCGHFAPPLHEKANRSAPFGLDLLDFHSRISSDL